MPSTAIVSRVEAAMMERYGSVKAMRWCVGFGSLLAGLGRGNGVSLGVELGSDVCVRWVLLWTYGGSFREHLLSLSNSSKYVSLRASGFLQPPTLLGLTGVGCGASCGAPGGLWRSYSERGAGTGRRPAWDGSRVTGRPLKRAVQPMCVNCNSPTPNFGVIRPLGCHWFGPV